MKSYLTPDEWQCIQHLPPFAPYIIQGVLRSQFSVARFYGGIKFEGYKYYYSPLTDELIRSDVLKHVESLRKIAIARKKAAEKQAAIAAQQELI